MAEITSFLFVRHLRGDASAHVIYARSGKKRESGRGRSFWFLPLGAAIAELPLDDRELPFLFHGRSGDFQDLVVQGAVHYRIVRPETLAERVDFSLDLSTGHHAHQPTEKLSSMVNLLAQELAIRFVTALPLKALLERGLSELRDRIHEGLTTDPGLEAMGLEIVATRVASLRPSNETERALEMPTRESILQEADQATFQRRALAVEKERAIQENELATRIELARREEQLIEQESQNEKRRVVEAAERRRIDAEAAAESARLEAGGTADKIRLVEGAKNVAETDRMAIYRALPPPVMMGLAARELAGKLQSIEHLSVSPELLGPVFERLLRAGAEKLEEG